MNRNEAKKVLEEQLQRFGGGSYLELFSQAMAQRVETYEVLGESGVRYQVEVQFLWDRQPGGTIRVMGSIDDQRFSSLVPLTDCLLMGPPESDVQK
ncbi:hypothetical protein [uncultured Meiothermus sp.]|jgi:hypothetical protein|uniref:hypothetical protein n=1 Tax=uncultured Meiothermus sp. TaxID=157471 RepID=UPI002605BCD1|nr:hypothetical protein [uncultured Meiothermus sp.]